VIEDERAAPGHVSIQTWMRGEVREDPRLAATGRENGEEPVLPGPVEIHDGA
jgi:hypothetical protein